MSGSENEYSVMLKRGLERKDAFLASLDFTNFVNEHKQLVSQVKEEKKARAPKRKSVSNVPSRRSARIQEQSCKLKYVKGFRGFKEVEEEEFKGFDDESSDDCDTPYVQVSGVNKVTVAMKRNSRPKRSRRAVTREKIAFLQKKCREIEEDADDECDDDDVESVASGKANDQVLGKEVSLNKMRVDTSSDVELQSSRSVENLCIVNNNNKNENEYSGNNKNVPWYEYDEETCLKIIEKSMQAYKSKNINDADSNPDSDDDWSKYENIKFCLSTSESSSSNDSEDDSDVEVRHRRKRISHPVYSLGVPTLACDDVTEEMLGNIARRSSSKVYDAYKGTTCHQCRQKTFDTKTVCRSGRCVGVRGMFCGICLPRRYGEQVADALKDPSWECPVCRGMCNCSFCRARAGKTPTGIMYPEARQHGYDCVAEYLKDKDKDKVNLRKKQRTLKVMATDEKK